MRDAVTSWNRGPACLGAHDDQIRNVNLPLELAYLWLNFEHQIPRCAGLARTLGGGIIARKLRNKQKFGNIWMN